MKIVAATNNSKKLKEMERILKRLGFEVLSMGEAGVEVDPEENGETFAANAAIKAAAVAERCGLAAVADDSGLCVDALGGAPVSTPPATVTGQAKRQRTASGWIIFWRSWSAPPESGVPPGLSAPSAALCLMAAELLLRASARAGSVTRSWGTRDLDTTPSLW